MKRHPSTRALGLIPLALLLVAGLAALPLQALAGGVIQGQISSAQDQNPVPKAKVTILAGEIGLIQSTVTNEQGEYSFSNLSPSTYDVLAEADGFGTFRRADIPLGDGRTLRINLPLLPKEFGAMNEVEPPPAMDPALDGAKP